MYVPKRAVDKGWEAEGAETDKVWHFSHVLRSVSSIFFTKSLLIFLVFPTFFRLGFFFLAESCGLFGRWVPQILGNIFKRKKIKLT